MSIKLSLQYFLNFFRNGEKRSVRAKKNIVVSFISKGVSIIISFLIVPLTLSYISTKEYGIWMTISSIIMWFSYFDLGLGNGLRNKLAESLALDNIKLAKVYVSSAFAFISAIAAVMLLLFLLFARFISWNKVLNTEILANEELFKVVFVVFFFFCLNFIFSLISNILYAMQRYALNDIIGIITQLLGLAGIFLLVKTTEGSLLNLCLVYAGKTPLVMFFAGLILLAGSLSYLRPNIKYVSFKEAIPLLNLGLKFFLNQILFLVIAQSSVFIIAQFFGPSGVTPYNLAVRYMTIGSMLYIMVLSPFISAFTEAFTKNEYQWIKSTIRKINLIWILTSIFTVILAAGYKLFFKFWVGSAVDVPFFLIISLAISSIIGTWSSTYSIFLNGIGKVHLQMYLLTFQAILFIPLSYLFFKLNAGLASTVLAQIILYSIGGYFMILQYKKIINKKATGLWAK